MDPVSMNTSNIIHGSSQYEHYSNTIRGSSEYEH